MTTKLARLQSRRLADPFVLDEGELPELQQQVANNPLRFEAEIKALLSGLTQDGNDLSGWLGQEDGRPIHLLVAEDAASRSAALYFIQTLQTRFAEDRIKILVHFAQGDLDARRQALTEEALIEFGTPSKDKASVRYNAANSFFNKRNLPSGFKSDPSLSQNYVIFDLGSEADKQRLGLLRGLLELLVSSSSS
jgi:hypothetical protein